MIRLVLALCIYMVSQITFSQSKFEQSMQQAFQLMNEKKYDQAANLFERIGNAEPTNWLPYYHLSLLKTRTTFGMKDAAKIESQLKIAQEFADKADVISPNNSEIYVLKAFINVAKIASNPMVYGASLSGKTTELYQKAIALDKTNPRAHSGLIDFKMGAARFFKQDVKPLCKELQQSLELYENFKPASKLHPNWGKERVLEVLKSCETMHDTKTVTITVTVPNVKSNIGVVQFALYDKENFLKMPIKEEKTQIVNNTARVTFRGVKPGVYAITCYHDTNKNDTMDFNERGMPIEDFGTSNNKRIMGPPTFEMAKFTVENKSLDLTIRF